MSEECESGDLPLEELARRITSGAVRLAAATAAWLALVAEFDRREGWGAVGIRSCAHWLAWQCGLSPGAAREHVRVARALTVLPATAASFAAGRLSYAKVRALTRVAQPGTEPALLGLAHELTASQLERVVREWRRSDAVDAARVTAKQRFGSWWDDDGMLHVHMCLAPEDGAAFLAGVDSMAERTARRERAAAKRAAPGAAPPAGPGQDEDDQVAAARDRTTARRCAAVAQLASAAAGADRRAGDPPRRDVVVHVDAAVIAEDAAAGRAHLEGGPPLHPTQVRRMLCEATVVTMLERGREPLAVGRARRFATRAQRRALYRRDGGCARPGCAETRVERLHAHHLRHWLHGGPTDVANMVLLCDADHGLAHDLDLVMTRRDGRLLVTAPDGHRVWDAADAAFGDGVAGLTGGPDEQQVVGVQSLDTAVGHRPGAAEASAVAGASSVAEASSVAGASSVAEASSVAGASAASITQLLFPDRRPDLPDAMHVNGEPMDLAYVVGVLLANRDLERRLAAENGAGAGGLVAVA